MIICGQDVHPIHPSIYKQVLNQFVDIDKENHVLSIHNIMKEAQYFQLQAGDWFDPTRTCLIFR